MSEEIKLFFSKYIFGEMIRSIDKSLDNFNILLPALGLATYTEIMGGFVSGNLRKKNNSSANFRAFLPYLGDAYVKLDSEINLYDVIRNGIVHEFFPKGNFEVWFVHPYSDLYHYTSYDSPPIYPVYPGVDRNDKPYIAGPDTTVNFYVYEYFRDFKEGVSTYYNQLLDGEHPRLVENFLKAARLKE